MPGLHWCTGLSLVASRGYSQVAVHGFLIVVASHRLEGAGASVVVAHGLHSTGSIVVVHGLSCSGTYGIFPYQGSNPCLLHRQMDCLPLCCHGSPAFSFKDSLMKYILYIHYLIQYISAFLDQYISLWLLPIRLSLGLEREKSGSYHQPSIYLKV